MFDGIAEMIVEKLKTKTTPIKEKKNIMLLLDNLLMNEVEIQEEDELLITASDLEEEARNMMEKEEVTEEEKIDWKELKEAAIVLESDLISRKKDMEELSLLKIKEEEEEMKKEIEELKNNTVSIHFLSLSFSDKTRMKRDDIRIIHNGNNGWETFNIATDLISVYLFIIYCLFIKYEILLLKGVFRMFNDIGFIYIYNYLISKEDKDY